MKAIDLLSGSGELSFKKRSVHDLIRHIDTREEGVCNYSVFLGAGASFSSGVRTAGSLIDEWLLELFESFTQRSSIGVDEAKEYFEREHASWYSPSNPYSSLFEKKYEFPSQRRRFVSVEVDKRLPSIGYAYLVSLIDGNYFNTVFTTNFDDLINEAFYQFSNSRPIYCAHDSSVSSISITSKRPKIIKLHGDYLFEDIKSTIRETESLEQNMREKLIEFGKEYGIVVVGYSGNDRSIMDVLDFLTKQENYLRNGIYWCLRGSDVVNPQLRKLLWKDKVYPVIIDGFDEFFAQAHSILIKGGLNIGGGVGQSKLQKTLKGILDDKFGLGRNQIIAKQIQEIKNENNKDDISRLISSLAEDSQGASLGLADFKNLLEVESYEQKGDFDAAFKLCEEYYYACESKIAKPKYILKIIQIAAGKGDRSSALTWSEKLLEIDHLNVDFNLKKCSLISGLDRRVEFLTDLKKKFPYNFEIYNELASKKFKLIKKGLRKQIA